ncbi:MAG TPA: cytochrome c oxidase assembly protein [Micropepsaceae bacterium]|jgi:cytochrome c oxidase assembly protein subunit 11
MKITRNLAVFGCCFGVVIGMVAMSYAAVPLYYAFCRATGYGGTPRRADAAPGAVGTREFTVRFDTNIDPALPWSFLPEQRAVNVKPGEQKLVYFHAVNRSDKPIVGHATFNVTPDDTARYFNKIQCFCFTEQRLEPGESVEMPVIFFVSPTILKNHDEDTVTAITLSYTFYPATNQTTDAKKTAAVPAKGSGG